MMKSDHELKADVEAELEWAPAVNEAHIGVSATGGVVTLNGHVGTFAEKFGAEHAATLIHGVKAVANEIEVKLLGDKRSDSEIAAACLAAMRAYSLVPPEKFKVIVSSGWVTLEGTAERQYEKAAAEDAVRYLFGVTGISNTIKVLPRVSVADVTQKIEAALKRNAEIDAKHIKVEAHGSSIKLAGTVRSWAEQTQAIAAAWAAPGVTAVDNQIAVSP